MGRLKKIACAVLAAALILAGLSFSASAYGEEVTVDGVVYDISGENAVIDRYDGSAAELVIPAEVEGRAVTAIRSIAFGSKTALKSISLPDTVTEIEQSAFTGSGIESIVIPAGVTRIEKLTFESCADLKSVTIHDGVTYIGVSAFANCTSLKSIYVPASVTGIGKNVFKNSGVETVYGHAESAAESLDGFVPVPAFTGRQLALGADLTMIFYAICPDEGGAPTVDFDIGGAEKTVTGIKSGYEYVFRFEGITPQLMGETITATLHTVGYGDVVCSTSVREYLLDVAARFSTDDKLVTLVADTLEYGAAAQRYVDPSVADEELVNYGTALTPSPFVTPPVGVRSKTKNGQSDGFDFTSVGVRFENVNKIFVKFTAGGGFRLEENGADVTSLAEERGGEYVFYTGGVEAANFDRTYTFRLYDGETLVQTLTYSVNSMVASKYADPDEPTAALARATYNYGVSAKAYADPE